MKTDNYLSLCLEEAAKSPLHYRHGAIVVRGGKVIGRGHNDYRPGFNGGALKTGRIASGAYDGAASELKKKLKGKQKCKQDNQQHQQQSHGTFVPFENANPGGGHSVNQPLSMHSEMMAIYTALNASSTLSSTTFSREKPCFKLPRADKRKARLRRAVLEAYVKAVCDTSAGNGKLQVRLENKSNNKVKEDNNDNHNLATQTLAGLSLAFHKDVGAQKHHQNRKNEKKRGKKNRYQYQYEYGRYRQAQQAQSASKDGKPSVSQSDECDVLREHDSMTDDDHNNVNEGTISTTSSDDIGRARGRKDYKRVSAALVDIKTRSIADNTQSGKMKSDATSQAVPEPTQPVLLPIGRSIKADDRKQHSRLQGADLYVVRIGWTGTSQIKPPKSKAARPRSPSPPANSDDTAEDLLSSSIDSLSSLSIASTKSGTGSLHDELVNPEPSPSPSRMGGADHECSFDRDKIHASRPCYRCVAFMHKVGIRRVFWTNDAGRWEGGKVSALIDAMDSGMEDVANGGPTGNGVFVTKHEVLMLRRIMGAKAST